MRTKVISNSMKLAQGTKASGLHTTFVPDHNFYVPED